MRLFKGSLLALMLLAGLNTALAQTINAGRGDLPLTVPASYSTSTTVPLVILLHGYGSSGSGQDTYMKFSALVNQYGFLFVAPDGNQETAGQKNRFWNASKACCDFFATAADDSAYVLAIINAVKAGYKVDPERVYLIGHSNGGFMSYRAAWDHSNTIAAIASLAGAAATDVEPAPAHPVHVLQIHGTDDSTIAYAGADIRGNIYPSAEETVKRWAGYNGCSTEGTTTAMLDLEKAIEGLESTVTRFDQGCKVGGSSELWTIAGGSHIPSISDHFSRGVIEWLLAHPKLTVSNGAAAE